MFKRPTTWREYFRDYLLASVVAHLIWEIAQLPLYTIWTDGTLGEQAFAIAHCTAGDVVIAGMTLLLPVVAFGRDWPNDAVSYWRVAASAIAAGFIYTGFSEWANTREGNWSYAAAMPLVPTLRIGLTPLLQWLIIPALLLYLLRRTHRA